MVTEKEFTAYPVNIAADNWMTIFAGCADKVIKVSYGTTGAREEFLSITGANSTITFAANSGSYSKDLKVFQFWSYMITQGDSFIKGLSDIINSPSDDAIECIYLYILNDGTSVIYPITAIKGNTYMHSQTVPKNACYYSQEPNKLNVIIQNS